MFTPKILQTIIMVLLVSATAFAEGGGDITFKPANADPVMFSHDYHLKTRGIRCMACHFQLFSDDGGGYRMKKEKMTKQNFCAHCHNGLKGFDVTSAKNCGRCHKR